MNPKPLLGPCDSYQLEPFAHDCIIRKFMDYKKASDALIKLLENQITRIQTDLNREFMEGVVWFSYISSERPELIPEAVEYAYKKYPEYAKGAVGAFHDDSFDLSTISCTGNDFDPWKNND